MITSIIYMLNPLRLITLLYLNLIFVSKVETYFFYIVAH